MGGNESVSTPVALTSSCTNTHKNAFTLHTLTDEGLVQQLAVARETLARVTCARSQCRRPVTMEDHSDDIEMFVSITHAERHVAAHYLSAHDWDLNHAVAFFLENPPGPSTGAAGGAHMAEHHQAEEPDADRVPDLAVHGTTLPTSRPFPSFRPPAPPATANARPEVYDVDDDEDEQAALQAALQASLGEPKCRTYCNTWHQQSRTPTLRSQFPTAQR
jgi:hypothetical protein